MYDQDYSRAPANNVLRRADPSNQLSRITYGAAGGPYKKRPRKITKPAFDEETSQSACGGCPCWLLTILTVLAVIGLIALVLIGIGYSKNKMAGTTGIVNRVQSKSEQNSELTNREHSDNPAESYDHNTTQESTVQFVAPPKPVNSGNPAESSDNNTTQESTVQFVAPPKPVNCDAGFFLSNGKCLRCPAGSEWNGTNCIRKVLVRTETKVTTGNRLVYGDSGSETASDEQHNQVDHLTSDHYQQVAEPQLHQKSYEHKRVISSQSLDGLP